MTRLERLLEDVPMGLDSKILMDEPNKPIKIYEGQFFLEYKKEKFEVNGICEIKWQPNLGIAFKGDSNTSLHNRFDLYSKNSINIIVGNSNFKGFITEISSGTSIVEGLFINEVFIGDKTIVVDNVNFCVPNLRRFHGKLTQRLIHGKLFTQAARIILDYKNYEIILEMRHNFSVLKDKLHKIGGFLLLYNGSIKYKAGVIKFDKIQEVLQCLNMFLSFINGRRVAAMFIRGECNGKILWEDCKTYISDNYQSVVSWPEADMNSNSLNELYNNFCEIWWNGEDRHFLVFSIKWYNEANSPEISTDTRLIMAQTTLELIYNWWVIEKSNLISDDDAQNLNAANKIRLVLSKLNIDYKIPMELKELNRLASKLKFLDGPNAIVYVRNAFIHSNLNKRKKILELTPGARAEVVNLGLWYIELAILKILNYNGNYKNRITSEKALPWNSIN